MVKKSKLGALMENFLQNPKICLFRWEKVYGSLEKQKAFE